MKITSKYNFKEIKEKLEHCRNINLEDVTLDDVDEISSIKIDRRKPSNKRILEFITKVNERLVRISFAYTNKIAEIVLLEI